MLSQKYARLISHAARESFAHKSEVQKPLVTISDEKSGVKRCCGARSLIGLANLRIPYSRDTNPPANSQYDSDDRPRQLRLQSQRTPLSGLEGFRAVRTRGPSEARASPL